MKESPILKYRTGDFLIFFSELCPPIWPKRLIVRLRLAKNLISDVRVKRFMRSKFTVRLKSVLHRFLLFPLNIWRISINKGLNRVAKNQFKEFQKIVNRFVKCRFETKILVFLFKEKLTIPIIKMLSKLCHSQNPIFVDYLIMFTLYYGINIFAKSYSLTVLG